jgi:hypothetical protein
VALMPEHDVIEARVIDNGVRVVCRCGRVFSGEDARERHAIHHRSPDALDGIEAARQQLKGGQP